MPSLTTNDTNKHEIKIEFEIIEVNNRRKMRRVEHIRVEVYENGEFNNWLWMDDMDIAKNIAKFGAKCFRNTVQEFLSAKKNEEVKAC